jgi:hypothetical protein
MLPDQLDVQLTDPVVETKSEKGTWHEKRLNNQNSDMNHGLLN